MIRVNEIKLTLDEDLNNLKDKIIKKLRIQENELIDYKIFRESIDARKNTLSFVYSIDVKVKNEQKILKRNKNVKKSPNLEYQSVASGEEILKYRPVIVGTGPAGIFAGLTLAQRGYRPILLERGQDVDQRTEDVKRFWETGEFDPLSNVQFGEGGAGTFSDGKLTTRIKDLRCKKVLEELVAHGAPKEILYIQKPHVGTDILKTVVKNVRKTIQNLGGEIRFNAKVTDLYIEDGQIKGVQINHNEEIMSEQVILAIGHSARDTYEMLYKRNIKILQKPFSIGVRIEHPQDLINRIQYKEFVNHPKLKSRAADYRLTYQTSKGRAVYTFCMCPGGMVVGAASEEKGVVTNGMSEYKRDQKNANSALLVQVNTEDFKTDHPLGGVYFQRKWEQKAFEVGGQNYYAPAQLVGDFLKDQPSSDRGCVKPSYTPGVTYTELKKCLPNFVIESMKEAIVAMDKKLKGFSMDDAIMTGVETRSSAPIRIERDHEIFESVNIEGLFPAGEGAGYAGGIISAAVDGIRVAESIIKNYSPLESV